MSGTFYLVVFFIDRSQIVNRVLWESFHYNVDVPKIVWLFISLNAILGQVMNVDGFVALILQYPGMLRDITELNLKGM